MKIEYPTYEEKYVRSYEELKYGDQIGSIIQKIQLKTLCKMIEKEKSVVLDIGSGTGWASLFLAERRGLKSIVFDASKEMLQYAKDKAKVENVDLEAIRGDANMLPIRDKSIDYVISFRTLMQVSNPEQVISEMCRISNIVILDFPSKASISGVLWETGKIAILHDFICILKRNPNKSSELFKLFSGAKSFWVSQIDNEFEKNQFCVIEKEKYFILPIFVHRLLNKIFSSMKLEYIFKKTKVNFLFGSLVIIKAKRKDWI